MRDSINACEIKALIVMGTVLLSGVTPGSIFKTEEVVEKDEIKSVMVFFDSEIVFYITLNVSSFGESRNATYSIKSLITKLKSTLGLYRDIKKTTLKSKDFAVIDKV